ncbi:hypothetical protein DL96DRAFT_1684037 [Flagelloscypha sp. PMI_526]|nr:hypothetical protein DL96DRAFT_1684037 [Flagelloscypha sp. PMI_526]
MAPDFSLFVPIFVATAAIKKRGPKPVNPRTSAIPEYKKKSPNITTYDGLQVLAHVTANPHLAARKFNPELLQVHIEELVQVGYSECVSLAQRMTRFEDNIVGVGTTRANGCFGRVIKRASYSAHPPLDSVANGSAWLGLAGGANGWWWKQLAADSSHFQPPFGSAF